MVNDEHHRSIAIAVAAVVWIRSAYLNAHGPHETHVCHTIHTHTRTHARTHTHRWRYSIRDGRWSILGVVCTDLRCTLGPMIGSILQRDACAMPQSTLQRGGVIKHLNQE